jgi:hypothetical protein
MNEPQKGTTVRTSSVKERSGPWNGLWPGSVLMLMLVMACAVGAQLGMWERGPGQCESECVHHHQSIKINQSHPQSHYGFFLSYSPGVINCPIGAPSPWPPTKISTVEDLLSWVDADVTKPVAERGLE